VWGVWEELSMRHSLLRTPNSKLPSVAIVLTYGPKSLVGCDSRSSGQSIGDRG
jgi:hypothetical protein